MSKTTAFFRDHVLPSYEEYFTAEDAVSQMAMYGSTDAFRDAQRLVLRRASALAICLDGLRDRWAIETSKRKKLIDEELAPRCNFGDEESHRPGCLDRVRAVANAFKHAVLSDPSLPIRSEDSVVVLGAGFGVDGFSVPKFDGQQEVLVLPDGGGTWCFRGDAHCATRAWAETLTISGNQIAAPPWSRLQAP